MKKKKKKIKILKKMNSIPINPILVINFKNIIFLLNATNRINKIIKQIIIIKVKIDLKFINWMIVIKYSLMKNQIKFNRKF